MLNPINRTNSRAGVQRYKVEPYVVAGDVYAEASARRARRMDVVHRFSRLALSRGNGMDSGISRARHNALSIDPCIPRNWPGYSISFRYHSATYKIKVENPARCFPRRNPSGTGRQDPAWSANIPLVDDGIEHQVLVVLG